MINCLRFDQKIKASQTAIFNRIEKHESQTDDQSSAFVQDTFNAIQVTSPKADLEVDYIKKY